MTDPGDTDDAGAIFSILVENSTDMLVLSTPDLRRLYVSPSCSEVLGYSSAELLGQTPFAIVHPEDRDLVAAVFATLTPDHPTANVAWRGLRPNGEFRWLETTYRRLPDGRIVAVVRDIQQRKAAEEQLQSALSRLERLAMYDPLTGIPNRRAFLDTLEHRLSSDGANHHAVLLVDLDDFKPVNDRYGHAVGDDVLTGFARRLENVRATILPSPPSQSWLVARLGGDEFAVLLNSATSQD
jgi:PAS domain S-box-containing protein